MTSWWLTDLPIRLDWWPGAESYLYVFACPLAIVTAAGAVFAGSLAFVTWRLQRHGYGVTLW